MNEIEGIVLKKTITAGGFSKVVLLSPIEGLLICMERTSRQAKRINSDLFDQALIELDTSKQKFIKSYTLLSRCKQLPKSYTAFKHASQLANFLAQHLHNIESYDYHYKTLKRAIKAWENGYSSSAILLKTLFLFFKHEGYPIEQTWLIELPPHLHELTSFIIRTPLNKLSKDCSLEQSIESFSKWIVMNTEFKPLSQNQFS